MRKNKLTQGVVPTWKMNTEGLTDEDLRVLESVNFPKEVRQGKVAFCRVIKNKVGGIFGRKESLLLDDLKYGQTSKAVAIRQINTYHNTTAKYDSTAQANQAAQKLQRVIRTRKFEQYYIDGNGLNEEMQEILSLFSSPKPTPSMKKPTPVVTETVEVEPIVETQKNLSNIDKGKVKEMHKNGASANEMAKELGEDKKERIINYLKTL
jgi:hypothetical protein